MSQSLTLLQQREIEAKAIAPFFKAVAAEVGRVRAAEILTGVVRELAHRAGCDAARTEGGRELIHLKATVARWCEGGALELTILQDDDRTFAFNVTRCQFAEMYQRLGLSELGPILSCGRDGAMVAGFNPQITFSRTQTIVQGAPFCNFRYELTETCAEDR